MPEYYNPEQYSANPYWSQVWEQFMGNPLTDNMYTDLASGQIGVGEFAKQIDPSLVQYQDWQSKLNLPSFSYLQSEFGEVGEEYGLGVEGLQQQYGTEVGKIEREFGPELQAYTGLGVSPSSGMKRREELLDLYEDTIAARGLGMDTLQSEAAQGLLDATKGLESDIGTLIQTFLAGDPAQLSSGGDSIEIMPQTQSDCEAAGLHWSGTECYYDAMDIPGYDDWREAQHLFWSQGVGENPGSFEDSLYYTPDSIISETTYDSPEEETCIESGGQWIYGECRYR